MWIIGLPIVLLMMFTFPPPLMGLVVLWAWWYTDLKPMFDKRRR